MTSSSRAATVRLSEEDHRLLQLLCLATHKSQNALFTELLHREVDRVLPGKRDAIRAPGGMIDFYRAIGAAPPEISAGAQEWARLAVEAQREVGDEARPAA